MNDLMRDPNQPPVQVDLEGVGEKLLDPTTDVGVVVVRVSFIPNDLPELRRAFASNSAATEFMQQCQPDLKAQGSPKQLNAKRAAMLRISIGDLLNHQVQTEIIKRIKHDDALVLGTDDLQAASEVEDVVDTFQEGEDEGADGVIEALDGADDNGISGLEDEVEAEEEEEDQA